MICWLRLDLRLADNPALLAATESGAPVIPVFTWSPDDEAPWAPGGASRWWLHQSLTALDASLRDRGSRLIVRQGSAVRELLSVARAVGATHLAFNTMKTGFTSVQQHIDALRAFKAAV